MQLKLGLKEIESPEGLGVAEPHQFAQRLRSFLDDIRHLKFLKHFEIDLSSARNESEKMRLTAYAHEAQKVRLSIWKSLGHFDDSLLGLRQLFENLSLYLERPDLHDLKASHEGDALVIAAGPSLDESLALLKEDIRRNGKRFLIIAVDAALKACLRQGIEPHIVTVIERDEHSLKFVQNLPKSISSILVMHPLCKREIAEAYPGSVAFASKLTGPFMWFPFQRKRFLSGSSSAHLAYQAAAILGAKRIGLVAQDLCFHPETLQSHGQILDYPEWSAPQDRENLLRHMNSHDEISEASGNTFAQVLTTSTWRLFAEDFEMIFGERKIPTVNTSRLGLKLPSAPYQSLEIFLNSVPHGGEMTLHCPSQNPRQHEESQLFLQKREKALTTLQQMKDEIVSSQRQSGVELQKFYDAFVLKPHFLELCFELIFRDWVEAENALMIEGPDTISAENDRHRRQLISRAQDACEKAIEILKGASLECCHDNGSPLGTNSGGEV